MTSLQSHILLSVLMLVGFALVGVMSIYRPGEKNVGVSEAMKWIDRKVSITAFLLVGAVMIWLSVHSNLLLWHASLEK